MPFPAMPSPLAASDSIDSNASACSPPSAAPFLSSIDLSIRACVLSQPSATRFARLPHLQQSCIEAPKAMLSSVAITSTKCWAGFIDRATA